MKRPFAPFPNLYTRRLVLRRLSKNDIPTIYDYQSNRDNFPYVNMEEYKVIEEAKEYIDKMNNGVEQSKWIIWAITLRGSSEIIGTISIWNLNDKEEKAELGYGLYPGNQGQGFMTETLKEVTKFAFEQMELKSVDAYTNINNIKSIDLLKRNDFRFKTSIHEYGTEMAIYEKKAQY